MPRTQDLCVSRGTSHHALPVAISPCWPRPPHRPGRCAARRPAPARLLAVREARAAGPDGVLDRRGRLPGQPRAQPEAVAAVPVGAGRRVPHRGPALQPLEAGRGPSAHRRFLEELRLLRRGRRQGRGALRRKREGGHRQVEPDRGAAVQDPLGRGAKRPDRLRVAAARPDHVRRRRPGRSAELAYPAPRPGRRAAIGRAHAGRGVQPSLRRPRRQGGRLDLLRRRGPRDARRRDRGLRQ